jgi:DNA-directed RNA polymerase subunit RPC12/RpoP
MLKNKIIDDLKIKCPKCGKMAGADTVKKAGEKSRKKLEAAMKELGTISVKNDWEILCGGCGKKIVYNPYTGQVS